MSHECLRSVRRWDYLTEKFAYEKRVKENKLKVAMMQVNWIFADVIVIYVLF